MSFQWKDRYSLGIPEIDKQHQRLFEIGNQVYDIAISDATYDHYDEIMEALQELYDYTEYHFGYEENLLKTHDYKETDQHKRQHIFFVEKIKATLTKDIDENQQEATLELLNFLSEWISSHILISDRKYVDDFKSKGII